MTKVMVMMMMNNNEQLLATNLQLFHNSRSKTWASASPQWVQQNHPLERITSLCFNANLVHDDVTISLSVLVIAMCPVVASAADVSYELACIKQGAQGTLQHRSMSGDDTSSESRFDRAYLFELWYQVAVSNKRIHSSLWLFTLFVNNINLLYQTCSCKQTIKERYTCVLLTLFR